MAPTSVFLSGATGYIAQHIAQDLVSHGYKVVGTVRSTEKGDRLKKNLGSNFTYEIVKDIGVKGAFDEALKAHPEVTVFLHTASPFHFNVQDVEKDLLNPAVEGTKNALSAIATHAPQVTRVVVTSSYASIFTIEKDADSKNHFDEDSWNEITWEEAKADPAHGYCGSKTFAEKAAWDFVKNEKPHFKLSTVNPSYVFGPQAFSSEVTDTLNTSAEIINSVLKLKPDDEVPSVSGLYVDVRDVAKAHRIAFEKEDAAGQRLFTSSTQRFHAQDILDIVNENFSQLKGKIPVGKPGSGTELTKGNASVNNDRTKKLLGFEFINLKKSVIDTIQQLLDVNKKL